MSKICFKLSLCLISLSVAFSFHDWASPAFSQGLSKQHKAVLKAVTPRPDIAVYSFTAPETMHPGEDVAGKCQLSIKNLGTADAENFNVDIVLSSNSYIPLGYGTYSEHYKDDVLLGGGRSHVARLKPGEVVDLSNGVMGVIPSDTPSGTYYLGIVVDPGRSVPEVNNTTANNIGRRKIQITQAQAVTPTIIAPAVTAVRPVGVDLQIVSFGVDKVKLRPGETIKVDYQLTNTGSGHLNAFNMEVSAQGLRSRDTKHVLRRWGMPTSLLDDLRAGKTISQTWVIDIPSGLEPGDYRLIIRADADGYVDETNENNNSAPKMIRILSSPPPPTARRTMTMTMEENTNYFGKDYNDGRLPREDCGPECCRDACRKDPRCKAYTWVKPGVQGPTARCWLKNAVPPKSTDHNTISGRKVVSEPAPPPTVQRGVTMTMEENTNYFGKDYNDGRLPQEDCGPECCRDACRKDPRCKAYTWVKPGVQGPTARCWLKNAVPAKSTDYNTISGRKVVSQP
jgi:hypothetical protein